MGALSIVAAAGLAVLIGGGLSAHETEAPPKFKSSIEVGKAKEGEFPGLAKITFQQAIGTALTKITGSFVKLKAELEDENGLIYSVEAKMADGTEIEVNIDAGNGKVLDVQKEERKEGDEDEDGDDD